MIGIIIIIMGVCLCMSLYLSLSFWRCVFMYHIKSEEKKHNETKPNSFIGRLMQCCNISERISDEAFYPISNIRHKMFSDIR